MTNARGRRTGTTEDDMSHIAATFRRLHSNTTPLRLPNTWDAGSARLFESQGATAIATTSAGSGITQVLWGKAQALARDFLESGRSEPLSEASMPYGQLQGLFPEN
jgi:hypothetical protein